MAAYCRPGGDGIGEEKNRINRAQCSREWHYEEDHKNKILIHVFISPYDSILRNRLPKRPAQAPNKRHQFLHVPTSSPHPSPLPRALPIPLHCPSSSHSSCLYIYSSRPKLSRFWSPSLHLTISRHRSPGVTFHYHPPFCSLDNSLPLILPLGICHWRLCYLA